MIIIYGIILSLLSILGSHRFLTALFYLKHRKNKLLSTISPPQKITIQLPIFNEQNVVQRLLDAVCSLEWPKNLLEIQVLDDSTDETKDIIKRLIRTHQSNGLNIRHIHRDERTGYKAGALAHGLQFAQGEFIAIFDADFIPPPNFLEHSMQYFTHADIGMVQTRWGHLNRHQNLLTELTAILLDGHFVIEHFARMQMGRFFNFNGTAGIWRRTCIEDAGGWHHDTITEDLDLSYRAQLKGWEFVYLKDFVSPAEIPSHVSAFATQQFRWAKGTTQTAIKLLPSIWSARISFWTKLEASFHFLGNLSYPLILCLVFLMPISAVFRFENYQWIFAFPMLDFILFISSTLGILFFYGLSQKEIGQLGTFKRLALLPLSLALGIGLSVQQTKAVWQGIRNQDQVFIRTPKQGDKILKEYVNVQSVKGILELSIGLYCLVAIILLLSKGIWASVPFLALFSFGFSYVGFGLLLPQLRARKISTSSKLPTEAQQGVDIASK
jgi:cellulose synthase/poly-beta-1,6-N-acetylglucosamine synthase-like glycosyltransferase